MWYEPHDTNRESKGDVDESAVESAHGVRLPRTATRCPTMKLLSLRERELHELNRNARRDAA